MAITSPLSHPWHFFALEVVVVACFALTLRHAVGCFRRGDRLPLFQWLAILVYGIAMELIAFTFIDNYTHATFTVQLYHGKLPLYVTCVYLVLHYTGLVLAQRLGLGAVAEALVAGFAIAALDVPFDTVGVDAKWWIWSDADPNVSARFLGVPVTSYYWYMLFGAVLAGLCRALRTRVARWHAATWLALAPAVAAAVLVLGTLAFLPFHALKALGVPDGAVVAAHAAVCVAVLVAARAPNATPVPRELAAIAVALPALHLAVLLALWSRGDVANAGAKLAFLAVAAGAAVALARTRPSAELRATATPGSA